MAATPIDLLTEYNAGEFLLKEDINALIRLARRQNVGPEGVAGSDTNSQGSNRLQPQILWGINASGGTIPAYSIFAVSSGALGFSDPPQASLKKFGRETAASPFTLYTNGQHAIANNYALECLPVSFSIPRLLRVDPAQIPIPGATCGPKLESFEITKEAFGLVCLSDPEYRDAGGEIVASDSESIDAVYIWCIQSAKPVRLIGFVYGAGITAYDSATQTLGSGTIKVNFRHNIADADADKLQVADNTAGAEWVATVYNRSSSTYAVGELVTATETTGVGLLADVAGVEQVALASFISHISPATPYAYPEPATSPYDIIFPAYIQRAATFIDDPADGAWSTFGSITYPPGTNLYAEPVFIYSIRRTYIPPAVSIGSQLRPVYKINGKWHCNYNPGFRATVVLDTASLTTTAGTTVDLVKTSFAYYSDNPNDPYKLISVSSGGVITCHRNMRIRADVRATFAFSGFATASPTYSAEGQITSAGTGSGSISLPYTFAPVDQTDYVYANGYVSAYASSVFSFDAGQTLKFILSAGYGGDIIGGCEVILTPEYLGL